MWLCESQSPPEHSCSQAGSRCLYQANSLTSEDFVVELSVLGSKSQLGLFRVSVLCVVNLAVVNQAERRNLLSERGFLGVVCTPDFTRPVFR